MVMRIATTIQMTSDEDKEVSRLKEEMRLPSKKAVVLEGLQALRQILQAQGRRRRLQVASRAVRGSTVKVHQEWAALSAAVKNR